MKSVMIEFTMKQLAKAYKKRAYNDANWQVMGVHYFVRELIREEMFAGSSREISLADGELYLAFRSASEIVTKQIKHPKNKSIAFEDFFKNVYTDEWRRNFTNQSERTYAILKFLATLHKGSSICFNVEYSTYSLDDGEDDTVTVTAVA